MNTSELLQFKAKHGLSTAAIARMCGKNQNTMGGYMKGKAIPADVATILTVYDMVTVLYNFLHGAAPPPRKSPLRRSGRSPAPRVSPNKKGTSHE